MTVEERIGILETEMTAQRQVLLENLAKLNARVFQGEDGNPPAVDFSAIYTRTPKVEKAVKDDAGLTAAEIEAGKATKPAKSQASSLEAIYTNPMSRRR